MKVLLTSAGLETENIKNKFLELLPKNPQEIKALFIPTAAVSADAISVLPKCMNDLLKCDIRKENITVYDLHQIMSVDEFKRFDVIYICGGDTEYLLKRVNEDGFDKSLVEHVKNNGVFVGVSAGSIIATQNLRDNLGLINCHLSVHCAKGDTAGPLNLSNCPNIRLTNNQTIHITDVDCALIIE